MGHQAKGIKHGASSMGHQAWEMEHGDIGWNDRGGMGNGEWHGEWHGEWNVEWNG